MKASYKRRSLITWFLGLVGLGALSTAYIDPGSGSFLVQALVAGVLGAALLIRTFWTQIKALFTRKSAVSEDKTPPQEKG
jgi:hypothetical protein